MVEALVQSGFKNTMAVAGTGLHTAFELPECEGAKEVYVLEMGVQVEGPSLQTATKEAYGYCAIGNCAADAVYGVGEATHGDIMCQDRMFTASDGTRIVSVKHEDALSVYRGKARLWPNQKNGKFYITVGTYSNDTAVRSAWARVTYLVIR